MFISRVIHTDHRRKSDRTGAGPIGRRLFSFWGDIAGIATSRISNAMQYLGVKQEV
ncbi:MAG: hypothetical protein HKN07_04565 [Acidimicrobiia bacterium]|nr:hypothetical protein [Acidimicrobiia bacterium]